MRTSGSWRMRATLRRQAAVALTVWAIAFLVLAAAYALPGRPQAALTVDDASPYLGETVHFDASGSVAHDSGNGRITAYNFSFGDGASTGWQSAANATHAYARLGTVAATVTVMDARGMTGQASAVLQVQPPPPPSGSAPDLVPVRATFAPAQPEVNATVTASVTVANRGGVDALAATIDVTDRGPDGIARFLESFPVDGPVAAGSAATFTGPAFRLSEAGNHTLTIVVANVTPAEPSPADHVLTATLVVFPAGGSPAGTGTGVSVSPLVLGLAVASLAAGVGAALFFLRPKPPGPLQPPPAEPRDRSPPPIWPP